MGGEAVPTLERLEPLLSRDELRRFRREWQLVQRSFVDQPQTAATRADGLAGELLQHLAGRMAEARARLGSAWDGGEVSTQDVRVALTCYRSFFERVLGN
jgi:hypothetical protein